MVKNSARRHIRIFNWIDQWSAYCPSNLEINHGGSVVCVPDSTSVDEEEGGLSLSDTIHAVEAVHRENGLSSVMDIPAVPLTSLNLNYVRDQRESFLATRSLPTFQER